MGGVALSELRVKYRQRDVAMGRSRSRSRSRSPRGEDMVYDGTDARGLVGWLDCSVIGCVAYVLIQQLNFKSPSVATLGGEGFQSLWFLSHRRGTQI